jgi:hypothetical protein
MVFASVPAGASPPRANVSGPAVTTGGNGFTTADFAYFHAGPLGSGTIHLDFTLTFQPPGATTSGTALLTRADGSTLSGTETSTVDFSTIPGPVGVAIQMHLTSGTGAFAGESADLTLIGTSAGAGAVGDAFALAGTLTAVPNGPHNMQVSATYTGMTDVHAPAPTGPYSGTFTANLAQGPLAGTELVARYSVSQFTSNHLEPGAENSVVISNPGGALDGVATSYSFSPDPPCAGIGCSGRGAVLTIHITGGTGRFAGTTGGDLTVTMDGVWLTPIEEFPGHFAQSITGTITGSLQR